MQSPRRGFSKFQQSKCQSEKKSSSKYRHKGLQLVSMFKAPPYKSPTYKFPIYKSTTYKSPRYKFPTYKATTSKSPSSKSPTHKSPMHKSPTHKSPTHKSPTHKSPTHKSPTHKSATYKSALSISPKYKVPRSGFLSRPLMINKPESTGPSMHGICVQNRSLHKKSRRDSKSQLMKDLTHHYIEMTKLIKSAVAGTVKERRLQLMRYHDVEMTRMIKDFRTLTGVSDARLKRSIRLMRTMRKLISTLFTPGKHRTPTGDETEEMNKRLVLLAELKRYTDQEKKSNWIDNRHTQLRSNKKV
uniref:Uncharacterized protein n=1 Tax=Strigamia maritima TaxID=126957 RepID=T1IMD1_STRMM